MPEIGKKLLIINYGMGNLRSVVNAFASLGIVAEIAEKPNQLKSANYIVLPGVGAFGDGMKNLISGGWIPELEEQIRNKGKPFLGICLGMQLLATTGTEMGQHKGLGWIDASVDRIIADSEQLKIPHVGWNDAVFKADSLLFSGMKSPQTFYFVHSFVLNPRNPSCISATTQYGAELVAAVESQNIFGLQFHPEKSQKAGLTVLKNFIDKSII